MLIDEHVFYIFISFSVVIFKACYFDGSNPIAVYLLFYFVKK